MAQSNKRNPRARLKCELVITPFNVNCDLLFAALWQNRTNTPQRAASVDGPAVVLDVFSMVREDYAERSNKYIHPVSKDE